MIQERINRRTVLGTLAGGIAAAGSLTAGAAEDAAQKQLKGNIKQSVCYWCYSSKIKDFDSFCQSVAAMGIVAVDLVDEKDWPVLQKYGLVSSMVPGVCGIEKGLNDKANHAQINENFARLIPAAAKNKYPNIICFSGNRGPVNDKEGLDNFRGPANDEEGLDNCVIGLKDAVKIAEDNEVTICMELLNSKVNHKNYMCDLSKWGIELCKRVNSPRFKLLYDIYHMQIMEGDVIRTIQESKDYFAHYHTGGNPGRNEIDQTQELYYPAIVKAIVDSGFTGYMAHEFIPKRDPLTSLQEAVTMCDV